MPQYVHIGDGGRRVVEWRQSFPRLVPLEETDTACPGSGAFSIHGSSGNRKTAVLRKNFISTEITYHCRTVDQVRRHQPIDTHDADHRVSISQVSVFPWIWFSSRRLSAISAQLDREYRVLRIDEGAGIVMVH